MTVTAQPRPPVQWLWLGAGAVVVAVVAQQTLNIAPRMAMLFVLGLAMGVALYHAAFGFTGAYRRMLTKGDLSPVTAQMVMLIVAIALFAPVLAEGQVLGHRVIGAVAPVGVSMALGAFIFGVGMQLGGGCGSGTLFTAGSGNIRMLITLAFFCVGAFWGSLDLAWWRQFPEMRALSFGRLWGFGPALAIQVAVLVGIWLFLRRVGLRDQRALWWQGPITWEQIIRGPWPLLFSGGLLGLFNWATLLIAGHAWSVTWGFTLWAAKAARMVGWDPQTSSFWMGRFQQHALANPVFADTTSVMNFGIILGAFAAATLAGKMAPSPRIALRPLLAAVAGGLMLGYGARLAYGCNIGAFFSGVASASLHGWVWIIAALPGNWIGIRLRPLFGFED